MSTMISNVTAASQYSSSIASLTILFPYIITEVTWQISFNNSCDIVQESTLIQFMSISLDGLQLPTITKKSRLYQWIANTVHTKTSYCENGENYKYRVQNL